MSSYDRLDKAGFTRAINQLAAYVKAKVGGVKGDAESAYRSGNVNITPANLGLPNVYDFDTVSDMNTAISQGTVSDDAVIFVLEE